jgi:hypothetical protein
MSFYLPADPDQAKPTGALHLAVDICTAGIRHNQDTSGTPIPIFCSK